MVHYGTHVGTFDRRFNIGLFQPSMDFVVWMLSAFCGLCQFKLIAVDQLYIDGRPVCIRCPLDVGWFLADFWVYWYTFGSMLALQQLHHRQNVALRT